MITQNIIVQKQSWEWNKCMGKQSYGRGITGIRPWNSEILGILMVKWCILAVKRQIIMVDEWCEDRQRSILQYRSTVTPLCGVTEVHLYATILAIQMDSII